jgi:hypothetical protein
MYKGTKIFTGSWLVGVIAQRSVEPDEPVLGLWVGAEVGVVGLWVGAEVGVLGLWVGAEVGLWVGR